MRKNSVSLRQPRSQFFYEISSSPDSSANQMQSKSKWQIPLAIPSRHCLIFVNCRTFSVLFKPICTYFRKVFMKFLRVYFKQFSVTGSSESVSARSIRANVVISTLALQNYLSEFHVIFTQSRGSSSSFSGPARYPCWSFLRIHPGLVYVHVPQPNQGAIHSFVQSRIFRMLLFCFLSDEPVHFYM